MENYDKKRMEKIAKALGINGELPDLEAHLINETNKPVNNQTGVDKVKELNTQVNQIVSDYDEKLQYWIDRYKQDIQKYDELVAELHKYCIMNDNNYDSSELYKKADDILGFYDNFKNNSK